MRTSLCLFAALALVAALALPFCVSAVRADAADADWQICALEGEEAALQGLTLSLTYHSGDHLYWRSDVPLDGGAQRTAFRTSLQRLSTPYERDVRADLYAYADFGVTVSGGELDVREMEKEGQMAAPLADLAEEARESGAYLDAAARESARESAAALFIGAEDPAAVATVDLSDYYDFVPFHFELSVPDAAYIVSEEDEQALRAFFRVPVPEGTLADVAVELDAQGRLVGGEVHARGSVGFYTLSCGTEEAVFLALVSDGAPLDYSHIPGGCGIYVLPLQTTRQGSQKLITPDTDGLRNALPLPESAQVQGLVFSDDETALYLFTREDGALRCRMLDAGALLAGEAAERQALSVCELPEGARLEAVQEEEDFLLVRCTSGQAAVLEKGEGGLRLALTADLAPFANAVETGLLDIAAAWDGARLAVAAVPKLYGQENDFRPCVAVYDETGLRCLCRLRTPLAEAAPARGSDRMRTDEIALRFAS